jgi:acyl carrier protein
MTINWGPWAQAGAAATDDLARRFAAAGLHAIEPESGAALAQALVETMNVQAVVLDSEPHVLRDLLAGTDAAFSEVSPPVVASRIEPGRILALSRAGDMAQMRAGVIDYLRREVCEVLQIPASQLTGADRPFEQRFLSELGVDSLAAVSLRNRLRRDFAIEMPVEKLLGSVRVDAVASRLQEALMFGALLANNVNEAEPDDAGDDAMETMLL